MTNLTTKEREQLNNLTVQLVNNLKADGTIRVTDKEIVIYKSIKENDPQNRFITLLKIFADSYGIPYIEDERKFRMTAEHFTNFYVCNQLANE